ncbi:MAG: glycogen/starch synthase [Akkermansia sp.]
MSTIRVLTLGWEFPPLVNGGLGIACLGLSKALAKKVDLRVIVPKADPSVLFDGFQLTGLNNVSYREVEQVDRKYSYDSFALVEHAPDELDLHHRGRGIRRGAVHQGRPHHLLQNA